MATDGIRPGADTPTVTRANVAEARRLLEACGHGRTAWVVDGERLHDTSESFVLEPCDAPPALPRQRARRAR